MTIATPQSLPLDVALQQAVAHHQAGRLQEAEQLYRAILQVQPNHQDANHNLGVLAVQVRQPIAGLAHFKRALESNPNQSQYWLSYIDALIQAGQTASAWEVLTQAQQCGLQGEAVERLRGILASGEQPGIKGTPPALPGNTKQPEINRKKATQHIKKAFWGKRAGGAPSSQEMNSLVVRLNQKRYSECETLARAMTARFPLHGFGWMVLGNVLKQQGRSAEALSPMRRAAELLPGDVNVYNSLGGILLEQGRLVEAEASLRQVLKIRPDFAAVHNNLGIILKEQGRFAEAESSYRRALELMPDFAAGHCNLGLILKEQERLSEAEVSLIRALALKPDFVEAHINLGATLLGQDRWSEAEASLHRALKLKPDSVEAHVNMGVTLLEQGRLTESKASCCRALEIKPDSAAAYYNLGNAFRDLIELDQSVLAYEKAIHYKPDMAEAYQALGDVFRFMDRKDDELFAYHKALVIDPIKVGMETAVMLAIRYYLEGNVEQSRRMLLVSQPIMATINTRSKISRIYWKYISRLLSCSPQSVGETSCQEDMDILYVIGESHALSPHGTVVRYRERKMRCAAQWIAGCKQWHLGNNSRNKYKHKFELIMGLLPRQSAVLLTIGEIDCRHDGGIIKTWKRLPDKSLDEVAHATVEAYVRYVAGIGARHGHRLVVSGVPAINFQLDELEADAAEQLVRLIRIFNGMLKELVLAAGMDFLDVYAFTDRGDGLACGQWHIDNFHLLPSAIAEAFDRCCLYG